MRPWRLLYDHSRWRSLIFSKGHHDMSSGCIFDKEKDKLVSKFLASNILKHESWLRSHRRAALAPMRRHESKTWS